MTPSSLTTSSFTYVVSLPSSKKQFERKRLLPCFRFSGTVFVAPPFLHLLSWAKLNWCYHPPPWCSTRLIFFCECVMIFLCLNSLAFVVLFLLNEDGIFEARFSENMTERGFLISSVGLQSNVPAFNRGSDSIDREAMWSNCEDSYRNYAFVKLRKMQSFYIPNLSLYVFYVFVHLFP